MKFIQITTDKAVNLESIDYISKDQDGFAVVHVGIESFKSSFPYLSLISLASMEREEPKTEVITGTQPSMLSPQIFQQHEWR